MAFTKKIPMWTAPGLEPPETLKTNGFKVGYKPPADYFNWFMHGASQVMAELQGMKPGDIGAPTNEEMGKTLQDANAYADGLVTIKRKKGALVSCETIEGLGIGVISHIEPAQDGSGLDSVSVTRTGNNLLGGKALAEALKALSPSTITIDENAGTVTFHAGNAGSNRLFNNVKNSDSRYTIILKGKNSAYTNSNIAFYYTDGTYSIINFESVNTVSTIVAYSSPGKQVLSVGTILYGGSTVLYYNDCGLFEGILTKEDFEAYNGKTLTAELPETVYGGTFDWGTGVLISTLDADGNDLTEPKVFQHTPQQILSIDGVNKVWSDCGETEATFNLTHISGITPETIGAAPAGYGLGGNIQRVTTAEELDAFRVSGWKSFYNVSKPLQAGGTNIYTGVVRCDAYSENYCVQTICSVGSGYFLQRVCSYGEWGEWEWIDPILYDGTEYRTTERIDGKAVYKKNVGGVIQYRLDGETAWKTYDALIVGADNTIHHTGNKPTGTYTGNGSSATRKIETGGIGNMLLVIGGWGYAALVFPEGCIYKEGTDLSAANDGIAYFRDGVLTIANTRENFNLNGQKYTYYVL